jgi:hypothetical protein
MEPNKAMGAAILSQVHMGKYSLPSFEFFLDQAVMELLPTASHRIMGKSSIGILLK